MNNQEKRISSIYNEDEAFKRGNLFPEIYSQYKNYKPSNINTSDPKQKLLLEIDEASFVAHDINLYLDIYPNDDEMIKVFNKYRERTNNLVSEYERKYGPLNINSDSLDNIPFLWEETLFPFEGGIKDVGI